MVEEKADSRFLSSPNGLLTLLLRRVSCQRRVSNVKLILNSVECFKKPILLRFVTNVYQQSGFIWNRCLKYTYRR
ncbi:hypothetical protein SAMN05216428_11141 [Nitrosospira sp. Nsp11]|nr:hypothetical protein SAMN05216428_11141 [Nitrosospira sp. Nsp11]